MSSFHFSNLNFKGDPLFPQLLDFCAFLVLQVLPLVYLAFEVCVAPLEFDVDILELVLFVLDVIETQRFAFEGGLQGGRLLFEILDLFLEA